MHKVVKELIRRKRMLIVGSFCELLGIISLAVAVLLEIFALRWKGINISLLSVSILLILVAGVIVVCYE